MVLRQSLVLSNSNLSSQQTFEIHLITHLPYCLWLPTTLLKHLPHGSVLDTVPFIRLSLVFSLEVLVFPCFGLLATCRSMEKLLLFDHDPFDRALDVGVLSTVARIKVCKPETETGDKIWLP